MKVYNTLSKSLEEFTPLEGKKVGLYTCGPTVYHYAHIGNLRYFIFSDILRRTLMANGYNVEHVMNITDVGHLTSDGDEGEDKLEKGASREGKTVWEVAQFYTDAFLHDIDRLNIQRANQIIPATSLIDKQIAMIKLLEEKGFTYKTDYAIYFDTTKDPNYGKLTGQKIEDKQTSRDEIVADPGKKRQADFALWFFLAGHYTHHSMHWPSPWGEGFPGWHIECSAINWAAFPKGTDIHTGGIDHIPVHHTNEIAQYEAALDQPMSKYWLHSNFLVLRRTTNDEPPTKMAKSGDNFLTLQTLVDKGFDPLAYRYFVLGAQYRSELQFSYEALEAAQNALRSLRSTIRSWDEPSGEANDQYWQQFLAELNDDLNTPKAIAVLWDMVRSDLASATKAATLVTFDTVLGLHLADELGKTIEVPAAIQALVEQREEARKAKDFAKADQLRQEIEAKGYVVEDTAQGAKIVSSK